MTTAKKTPEEPNENDSDLAVQTSYKPTRREIAQYIWNENRKVILVGAGCLVVGVAIGIIVSQGKGGRAISTDASYKGVFINSTIKNEVTTVLIRRGHPGNKIRWDQTGEIFASQKRAADAAGVSEAGLINHLQGKAKSIKGQTFTKLGEMV